MPFKVPQEVVDMIACRIASSIREVEGALNRVVAYASLTGEVIDLGFAQSVLGDTLRGVQRRVTIDEIQKLVSEHFEIKQIDLLSARRVGPTGRAYGVDMTEEMLALAINNATQAGTDNVEFLKGRIENVPLPAGTIDVVISNCVINLSTDKPAVLAEMFRVLKSGGRLGISDVVAEDHLTPAARAERGSYVGCIAGALSRSEYLDGLAAVGFVDADVTFTNEAAPEMYSALIRASKPA